LIAVMSDIHANLEALQAVLRHMGSADSIFCAGDIVGYGPNPNECCELVRSRGIKCVMGNHDIVCANLGYLDREDPTLSEEQKQLTRVSLDGMNEVARLSAEWTHEQLTEENRQFLRGLPLEIKESDITMLHGSVGSDYEKLNTYLDEKFAETTSRKGRMTPDEFYAEMLDAVQSKVLVVGHTHIPTRGYYFVHGWLLAALPFLARERWVLNPGSVGQPRRGTKATYATITIPTFPYLKLRATFHYLERNVKQYAVEYDRETTVRKIQTVPGLHETARFMLARWM